MRALLLVCLLGAAASVSAKFCNVANYACVSGREFCLGNVVFECAEGTVCTGSKNGQSPCTFGTSGKTPCPGEFDDFACCSSKHYCLGGFQVACGAGKRCLGAKVPGGHPCHDVVVREGDCDECEPVVKCETDCDKPVAAAPPPPPPTCPKGDWQCTSDTTYCEGGVEIKCPSHTVCRGCAPCVHTTDCRDRPGTVPKCTETDWTCLNDREYCHNATAWNCPEGTTCTGSVDNKSPCTVQSDLSCPGPFDDFQCIDKGSYCLGGVTQKCAANTYCDPANDGSGSPCKSTPPTAPVCAQPDSVCSDFTQYCAGGIGFACPADSVCRGYAPCVTQPDDTCSEEDFDCLDHRDFCFQGEVLRCPDGFKCAGSPDGKSNPCQEDSPAAICPGPFDDYTCFDTRHYCLDGVAVECPTNTWCTGNINDDESPCQAAPPANSTCNVPNFNCTNSTTYCYDGNAYHCPASTECAGIAPFPCVESAWCPVEEKEEEEPCIDKCDHPKPPCKGKDCHKPVHPKPVPPPKEPQCVELDWHCYGKREFCFKGEILLCPYGTVCTGSVNGGHCCNPDIPKPKCGGAWSDYECIDSNTFCLGGHQMKCAAGLVCTGSSRGESPCRWPVTPVAECPLGEYKCTSDNTYCSGGQEYTCRGGAVCRGWAPCVYETGPDPCIGGYC